MSLLCSRARISGAYTLVSRSFGEFFAFEGKSLTSFFCIPAFSRKDLFRSLIWPDGLKEGVVGVRGLRSERWAANAHLLAAV